jgi:hypothetical protein
MTLGLTMSGFCKSAAQLWERSLLLVMQTYSWPSGKREHWKNVQNNPDAIFDI